MEGLLSRAVENAVEVAALAVALEVGVPTLFFAWRGW
jgi:hypothetical protein